MKTGMTLQELSQEVARQHLAKHDFVAPERTLSVITIPHGQEYGGGSHTDITSPGEKGYRMTEHMHKQVAAHLNIPKPYYDRMRIEQPQLLDRSVNTWFSSSPTRGDGTPPRRLVRTLDGQARALLSDRYRMLDNIDLMEQILPELASRPDMQYQSMELTPTRLYIKATTPRLQGEVRKGDVVTMGIMLKDSEVGMGGVDTLPFIDRLACINGMVVTEYGQSKYHVGRQLMGDDEYATTIYSDEARRAEDLAFWLKVRDTVRAILSGDTLERILERMRYAAGIEMQEPEAAIEYISRKYTLLEGEQESILKYLIEGGDVSMWGMANAVTRTASDAEDYDRATELETVGGDIVTMTQDEFETIAGLRSANNPKPNTRKRGRASSAERTNQELAAIANA